MKKLSFIFFCIAVSVFCACSNTSTEEPNNGFATITFRIANFEQTNLDSLSTRSASIDTLGHLAMAIYDASTQKLIDEIKQDKGNADYGTFCPSLPYGNYTIVFLGYDGSRTPQMNDPKAITFADDYVPNLFCKSINITVNSSTPSAQSISIARAVACFSLVCDGDIPSNLSKMQFTMQGGSGVLNALTSFADAPKERTYTFKNLSSFAGENSMTINLYTFLTAEESSMDYTINALDADDNIIRTRVFSNVPMKINQRSRYTGSFFEQTSAAQEFSILLENADWEEKDFGF